MNETLAKIVAEIVISIAGLVAIWGIAAANKWLTERLAQGKDNVLTALVRELVQAAEQIYQLNDLSGEKRKSYVEENLKALGYELTDAINAKIESAVWEVNREDAE